jgi:hypothetical protein
MTTGLVEEMLSSNNLTSTEQKVANGIAQQLSTPENKKGNTCMKLELLLALPVVSLFYLLNRIILINFF